MRKLTNQHDTRPNTTPNSTNYTCRSTDITVTTSCAVEKRTVGPIASDYCSHLLNARVQP